MDSMAVNKAVGAVLLAGILYMGSTIVADTLVHPKRLEQSALKIDVPAASEASAGGAGTGGGAPAPDQPIDVMMASADPAAGQADTKKLCVSCHSFNDGGKAIVGPNLYGVVGGPHAHMAGYDYSAALKAKDGPWTYDELNAWLRKPAAYAPGTKMGFAGIADAKTRADVIDYLRTNAKDPMPLPAVAGGTPATKQTGSPEAGNGGGATPQGQGSATLNGTSVTQPMPPQGGPSAASPTPDAATH